jgi:hypothetical protein
MKMSSIQVGSGQRGDERPGHACAVTESKDPAFT